MKITKIEKPREIMVLHDDLHIFSNHGTWYLEGYPDFRFEIEEESGDDPEYVVMIRDKFENGTSLEQMRLYYELSGETIPEYLK